jgi:hypothetical protein
MLNALPSGKKWLQVSFVCVCERVSALLYFFGGFGIFWGGIKERKKEGPVCVYKICDQLSHALPKLQMALD